MTATRVTLPVSPAGYHIIGTALVTQLVDQKLLPNPDDSNYMGNPHRKHRLPPINLGRVRRSTQSSRTLTIWKRSRQEQSPNFASVVAKRYPHHGSNLSRQRTGPHNNHEQNYLQSLNRYQGTSSPYCLIPDSLDLRSP